MNLGYFMIIFLKNEYIFIIEYKKNSLNELIIIKN